MYGRETRCHRADAVQQCLASLAEMLDAYGLIARVAMKVSRKFDNGSFASEA
jgi:hypothetical protein